MKIKPVHVGLAIAVTLTFTLWVSGQHREAVTARALAEPSTSMTAPAGPNAALASTPEARAYLSRQAFEQETRSFLRDAPNLSDGTRNARALALSREIGRREQTLELSAGEAVMLRIGLIQAAVKDDSERMRQAQMLIKRYRELGEARQRAFLAQQRRDAQFQDYKAREARIVSEILTMEYYPGGMSRDDYLRQRLQEARVAIYGTQSAPPLTP